MADDNYPYAGDTALNDAALPPIDFIRPRPRGVTGTAIIVIFLGCFAAYVALRILKVI